MWRPPLIRAFLQSERGGRLHTVPESSTFLKGKNPKEAELRVARRREGAPYFRAGEAECA